MEALYKLTPEVEAALGPDWPTQEDKLNIVKLFNEGLSYKEIGDKYGVTRSSISGIIGRMRRQQPEIEIKVKVLLKVKKPREPKPRPVKMVTLKPVAEKPKRIRLDLLTSDSYVTMEELEDNNCKWPIGTPATPDFKFCGRPIKEKGCPYCLEHAVISYIPPKRRYG